MWPEQWGSLPIDSSVVPPPTFLLSHSLLLLFFFFGPDEYQHCLTQHNTFQGLFVPFNWLSKEIHKNKTPKSTSLKPTINYPLHMFWIVRVCGK